MNYSRERVNSIKSQYPVGTRIELISLCNYEEGMPTGLRGTVVGVDDQPALLMRWDNGRGLSILIGEDNFRKLTQNEIDQEKIEKSTSYKFHKAFMERIESSTISKMDLDKYIIALKDNDLSYLSYLMKQLHDEFVSVYQTEVIETDEYEWVSVPAVIIARESGKLVLGLVNLYLTSRGEHSYTSFITPKGLYHHITDETPEELNEFVYSFIPYNYYYTVNIPNDIHVDKHCVPDDVREILENSNSMYQETEQDLSM